jgi:hypothetical protein
MLDAAKMGNKRNPEVGMLDNSLYNCGNNLQKMGYKPYNYGVL